MTEDLITLLSGVPDLLVIARHSSFACKGGTPDAPTIGSQLGVRYLLRGACAPISPRLRVTAHLVEAASSRCLWSEHYDRARDGVTTAGEPKHPGGT